MKNKLLAHIRAHFGLKPYECHMCSKSFNDKGNLKTHLRVHTGERPYKCNICSKAFKTEGQVREHFGSHFKNKPFQCPYCLKYYKRKGVLKYHMLIHRNDPSFLEKKDYYEEMVKKLDNKNSVYYSEISNRNNNTIFSTKEESQISCPNSPIKIQNEYWLTKRPLNSDNIFDNNYDNKNIIKFDDKYKFEEKEENGKDCLLFEEKKGFNSDDLFNEMANKVKNENNFNNIRNIFILGNIDNDYEKEKENENIECNNMLYKNAKIYNNNNIFLFDEHF